ncbi:conserved hypothetical protein [Actinomyces sp. oral taxon 180 str. F0310]|nr:conserved hypothetical protein [Actinomyces sp. oral taxon 180 str. F0310]
MRAPIRRGERGVKSAATRPATGVTGRSGGPNVRGAASPRGAPGDARPIPSPRQRPVPP